MPVLFLTSKHQGNILGMTQVKVAAETRTRERVFRVVKHRIRRHLKGYQAVALRDWPGPIRGREARRALDPLNPMVLGSPRHKQSVFTHPWSFRARASDFRHLKMSRRKKIVVIHRKRVNPSLQDARRKIPEAPAPRITHRLRMTDWSNLKRMTI